MCCHLQKNRPNSQKDRRLIKTGRQAGQTFGVRDVGHRGEKIMLHSTFTADWWEASSLFSDSICCSETLDSTSFSSHHTPFLAYHSLNLFYLWAGSVGDLPYVSLSTWTTSRWAEQGRAPADRSCFALSSHLSGTEKRPSSCHHQGSMNPPPAHVSHTEAWLNSHRLKCHWTLMYSPLLNTWLLSQSPLVWSTGFNFGRVDSGLATWDLHPEQGNTLAHTYPWHRTGLAQTKLYQLVALLHWQWTRAAPLTSWAFYFRFHFFDPPAVLCL